MIHLNVNHPMLVHGRHQTQQQESLTKPESPLQVKPNLEGIMYIKEARGKESAHQKECQWTGTSFRGE